MRYGGPSNENEMKETWTVHDGIDENMRRADIQNGTENAPSAVRVCK